MTQVKNLPVAAGISATDFVVGDVNGVTKRIPLTVLASEVSYTSEFVPIAFGAVGDGATDDTVALQACINAALAYAQTLPGELERVTVDGQGKGYAITAGITIAGNFTGKAAVILVNCTLLPKNTFPVNTYALTCTGSHNAAENVTIPCNRVANGFDCAAYGSVYINCKAFNFTQVGFLTEVQGDQALIRCESFQWFSSDPEYIIQSKWTAVCFEWTTNDCMALTCLGHTGLRVAWFTNQPLSGDSAGTTQLIQCNFYNGNTVAAAGTFTNNQLIQVDITAGGIVFDGCYLGNGRIDLYTDAVCFVGCTAITSLARDALPYYVGMHANPANTSPYRLVMESWLNVSPTTFGSTGSGKTLFFSVINDTGTAPGSFANLASAETLKVEASENIVETRLQIDSSLNKSYYSPNTTLDPSKGAGLAFFSGTTPTAQISSLDFFAIREIAGMGHLHRHAYDNYSSGTGTLVLTGADSGKTIRYNNASTSVTITLPHDAAQGWHVYLENYQGHTATGVMTVQTDSGYSASTWLQASNLGVNSRALSPGESVHIVCTVNPDGLSALFQTVQEGPFQLNYAYGSPHVGLGGAPTSNALMEVTHLMSRDGVGLNQVFEVIRNLDVTGGTATNPCAIHGVTNVTANSGTKENAIIAELNDSSTQSGKAMTAIEAQCRRQVNNTDGIFGAVIGAVDNTTNPSATNPSGLVAMELDIYASGSDSSSKRYGLDVVLIEQAPASDSSQTSAFAGVRVRNSSSAYSRANTWNYGFLSQGDDTNGGITSAFGATGSCSTLLYSNIDNTNYIALSCSLNSGVLAQYSVSGNNSSAALVSYAKMQQSIVTNTAGSETGKTSFVCRNSGSDVVQMEISTGVIVGAPTGGYKGVGTINVAGDIYKNNLAYTNPDYVFEHAYTGKIAKFINNEGAAEYQGLTTIDETEKIARETFRLPGFDDKPLGAFGRQDRLLQALEEAYLHIFALNERIKKLEAKA